MIELPEYAGPAPIRVVDEYDALRHTTTAANGCERSENDMCCWQHL